MTARCTPRFTAEELNEEALRVAMFGESLETQPMLRQAAATERAVQAFLAWAETVGGTWNWRQKLHELLNANTP